MKVGYGGFPIFEIGDRVRCIISFNGRDTDGYTGTCTKENPGIDWTQWLVAFDKPLPNGRTEMWVEDPDIHPLSLLERLADAADGNVSA